MTQAADQFLEESSIGDSYPAFKFTSVGDTVSGTILGDPKPVTRPSLNDGTPEQQLPINIETADGPKTVWVRKGFMAGAISDAVKAAGATGLRDGGKLAVKFTELRDTGKPQPAKVFSAKYEAPASAGANLDDIF